MAMLLQNFDFVMDDPSYKLQIAETLTIKPKGFYMRASLRHDMTPTELEHRLAGTPVPANGVAKSSLAAAAGGKGAKTRTAGGKPMSIFYGSNSGTCESLAQRLASDASANGFDATVIEPLDAAKEKLPTDRPVVIVTASYEGQPPDNAAHFVDWIQNLKDEKKELDNVSYAVYGCGHHDWVQTFHRIPNLVDSRLAELGATRLVDIGLTDAADRDMFSDFETWEDEVLWPAMRAKYGIAEPDHEGGAATAVQQLSVEVSNPRGSTLRQDVCEAAVVEARTLTSGAGDGDDTAAKRHLQIQLPTGMTYAAGDYLAVLPLNPRDSVGRAMRKFKLAWDAHLTIHAEGSSATTLPTDQSISAFDVLSAYVELAQPATKRNVAALMEATADKGTIEKLGRLAGDDYQDEIARKRVSILDLLEEHPSISLPLGSFLAMLPPMRVRQ
jgi:cytochrome P450/NADPH-cytochrome P450 reductase